MSGSRSDLSIRLVRQALAKRKTVFAITGGVALLAALLPIAALAHDPTTGQDAGVAADTV